jgi:predicted HTH domain antitoxin
MTLTVELPNDLMQHEDAAREALEAIAVEAYRTDAMTRPEAAKFLGMGRLEFQDVLKRHGVAKGSYGVEELLEDIATSDALFAAGKLPR